MAITEKTDYSLIGPNAQRAAEQGLVAAEWYHPDIPRKRMKELMRRSDGPALRDTALWLGLLVASGVAGGLLWGTWLTVPCFLVYGVLYGSSTDSRWHESGHGTAFKTSWINDVLYQVASFMNMKEPTFWRWSHARHHADTPPGGELWRRVTGPLGRVVDQAFWICPACLPRPFLSSSRTNVTLSPSFSDWIPASSSAVAWTNTSFDPSSGVMKPKPLAEL